MWILIFCEQVNGVNVMRIPSRDAYSFGLQLLNILFTKEELAVSLLFKSKKSEKPGLEQRRVENMLRLIEKQFGNDWDLRTLSQKVNRVSGQFQRHAGLDFLIYVHTLLTIPFYISCYGHTHYLLLICLCIIIIMVDSFTNHSLILFLVCVSYGRLFHKSLTDHLHCFFPTHCSCKILHVRRIDSHNTTYSSVYVLCVSH